MGWFGEWLHAEHHVRGAILMGQAIGHGSPQAVGRIVSVTMIVVLALELAIGAVVWADARRIMDWFAADVAHDGEFLRQAIPVLRFVVAWQICDAVAFGLAEASEAPEIRSG